MSSEKIGLYIGKFQPFHNGHLFAIKHIMPKVSRLIIVIGSSQYSNLADQPFSAQQRRRMIEQTMALEGIDNFSIIEVPDIHDSANWVRHVQNYVKQFNIVFTNNKLVSRLFSEMGFTVQAIPFLPAVSGTVIRRKLANKDNKNDWAKLVPSATAKIITYRLYPYPK